MKIGTIKLKQLKKYTPDILECVLVRIRKNCNPETGQNGKEMNQNKNGSGVIMSEFPVRLPTKI